MSGKPMTDTPMSPERLRALTQDRPDIPEILKTVAEFINGVAGRSSGSERYNALCAVFLLKVIERELAADTLAAQSQMRELARLTGAEPSETEPYAAFCASARAGKLDAQWDAVMAFALRQVIDKVRVTNPDYLEPMHREAVP
ncbi:MAG: hypothetical protein HYX64_04815 [Gammaproteobacteria bacterium]|nr:hypothetical protein [Gammaproteobacteria bacterium]